MRAVALAEGFEPSDSLPSSVFWTDFINHSNKQADGAEGEIHAPFSHRCLYDPWQTRTADSSLRGWRLRPTCRRGLMVCRVGFEPTNCNRPVLQTVCFDRLHTGTYKEALSLVVLPAGFEPAARGSSDHCSTC